jgi:hypothetical protein
MEVELHRGEDHAIADEIVAHAAMEVELHRGEDLNIVCSVDWFLHYEGVSEACAAPRNNYWGATVTFNEDNYIEGEATGSASGHLHASETLS